MTDTDIAWAAGLFEGEGCFTLVDGRPVAALNSTDEDVIRKFASVVGGIINGPYDKGGKPIFQWSLSGYQRVSGLYEMIEPFLCSRRTARGRQVLDMYLDLAAARAARPRLPRTCRNGHHISTVEDEVKVGGKRPQCRICYRTSKRNRYVRSKVVTA